MPIPVELERILARLPESALDDVRRFSESLLIQDDEGELCDEARAAIEEFHSGGANVLSDDEISRRYPPPRRVRPAKRV